MNHQKTQQIWASWKLCASVPTVNKGIKTKRGMIHLRRWLLLENEGEVRQMLFYSFKEIKDNSSIQNKAWRRKVRHQREINNTGKIRAVGSLQKWLNQCFLSDYDSLAFWMTWSRFPTMTVLQTHKHLVPLMHLLPIYLFLSFLFNHRFHRPFFQEHCLLGDKVYFVVLWVPTSLIFSENINSYWYFLYFLYAASLLTRVCHLFKMLRFLLLKQKMTPK